MADKFKFDIKGAKKEQNARREFDANRRDNAANILNPDQIVGKDWRSAKVLATTMGLTNGEMRKITKKDLIAFHHNITKLQSRVVKGVTANEVINLSTLADKQRSRQQINMAIPVRMKNGDIHFLTNAGPDSKVTRHNIHIILMDYDIGLAKGTPLQGAKEVAHGNLRFDCDCEHHTFVFRFITTLMGANAGRAETGFPKIRNPELDGIACKHVLRVMTELNSSIFVWRRIAAMIEADRAKNANKQRAKQQKTVTMTQKEANELAARQQKNPRTIKAIIEAAKQAKPSQKQKPASKPQPNEDAIIQKLAKEHDMTPEQIRAIRSANT